VAPSDAADRSTQTETEGWASLRDLHELVQGLTGLATADNVSVRPCAASLALLLHYVRQEAAAWNVGPDQQAGGAGAGQQPAAAPWPAAAQQAEE
jgi:hypothetical protein